MRLSRRRPSPNRPRLVSLLNRRRRRQKKVASVRTPMPVPVPLPPRRPLRCCTRRRPHWRMHCGGAYQ
eukprot:8267201-Prorocentrum_lima.AAC.1